MTLRLTCQDHAQPAGIRARFAAPRAAKRPVEFHLYEQGGHGFGMYNKTTTSTGWFEAFTAWMGMHGFMTPRS